MRTLYVMNQFLPNATKDITNSEFLSTNELRILHSAFPQGVVVFDLETTGLSSLCDHIIEIGAIKILPEGQIIQFETLIHPECLISQKSILIHGITDKMVENSPKIAEALPAFYEFIEELPLIAHNAQFDVGFLIFQYHQNKITPRKNTVYCSCQLARKTLKKAKNHKLSTLSEFLGVDLVNHHRATDDAKATVHVLSASLAKDPDRTALLKSKNCNLSEFTKSHCDSPYFQELSRLTQSGLKAKIRYTGGTYKDRWRPISPVSLLPTPRGDILYAHCLISDLYKSFLIDKLSDLKECSPDEITSLVETIKEELN